MPHFLDRDIERFQPLAEFIHATGDFGRFITVENVDEKFALALQFDDKAPKTRAWTLIEICALLGLVDHTHYLLDTFDVLGQVRAERYRALRLTMLTGHLPVFDCLLQALPEEPLKLLKPTNFMIFRFAVSSGSLVCVKRLVELVDAATCQHMVSSHGFEALMIAKRRQDKPMLHYLLRFPYVFTYACDNRLTFKAEINSLIQQVSVNAEALKSARLSEQEVALYVVMVQQLLSLPQTIEVRQLVVALVSVPAVKQALSS